MANVVGRKGQVVIPKAVRNQLGVEPGWLALPRVVDDHLEIRFIPPAPEESLMGSLKEYVKTSIPPGPEWDRAREKARRESAWDKEMGAREASE